MKQNRLNRILALATLGSMAIAAHAEDVILTQLVTSLGSAQGTLASLSAFDLDVYRIGANFGDRISWGVIGRVHVPSQSVRTMTIRLRAKRSPSNLTFVNLFDYRANQWFRVSTLTLPTTSFGNTSITITGEAGQFVGPGGVIQCRFDSRGPCTMSTNLLKISVTS